MERAGQSRANLEAIRATIGEIFPGAVLGEIEDETGIALSMTSVCLPNQVVISLANDIDEPQSKFMIMRTGATFEGRLPFEDAFEDGFGVSEQLDERRVVALLRQYAALPMAASLVH